MKRFMRVHEFTYVPYSDFSLKKEKIDEKYHTAFIWSVNEYGDVEYRNTHSFYGLMMRTSGGRLFFSGDELRTMEQSGEDTIANVR